MARRVGSPKELESSATTAVNAPGSSVTPRVATASPGTFASIIGSLRPSPNAPTGDREVSRHVDSELRDALASIEDPQLDLTLGDVGMLGDVTDGEHPSVELVVPIDSWPTVDALREAIRRVAAERGAAPPDVVVRSMDEAGIRALRAPLPAKMGAEAPTGD